MWVSISWLGSSSMRTLGMWLVAQPWHTASLQPAGLLGSAQPVAPASWGVFEDDICLPTCVLRQSLTGKCCVERNAHAYGTSLSLLVGITPATESSESGGHVSSLGNTFFGGNATSERKTVQAANSPRT